MVISISAHKGGSGKTTIATNLATSISQLFPDKKVLLIDLDGQCGVSISFGKSANNFVNQSILSIINASKQISDVIDNNIENAYGEKIDNLFVIYSEPKMRGFDHIINNNYQIQDNLLKILEHLKKQFDYLIIDTPPIFSSINVCAFLKSDIVITPLEADRYNIEGALNTIKELKKDIYVNKPYIYLLPNKIKNWIKLDNELLNYLDEKVKNENNVFISKFSIPDSNKFKLSIAKEKKPLMISNYKFQGAIFQKALFIQIVKDILNLSKKKNIFIEEENLKMKNLDTILNKNYDKWLDKINEKYKKEK